MLMFNARSIRNKLPEFRALVSSVELDIICITETWINTERVDFVGEFHLPGYTMVKKDRVSRAGGGVMLYVRSHLNALPAPVDSPFEITGVSIRETNTSLKVYVVYRPPQQPRAFDERLYDTLSALVSEDPTVICGDFNCAVDWDHGGFEGERGRIVDFANDNFLTQMVHQPTRGQNILDLIFASDEDLVHQVEVDECLGRGDHRMVFSSIIFQTHPELAEVRMKLNLRRADFGKLRRKLRELPPETPGTADAMWSGFRTRFMAVQSECIPVRRVGGSTKENPKWFSQEIGRAIRRRKQLNALSRREPNPETTRELVNQRRLVKRLVRRAKLAEERRVALACKTNPKEFYQHVSSRKGIRANIGPLKKADGTETVSNVEVANEFNAYFARVFTVEDDFLPDPVVRYEGEDTLTEVHCTAHEIAAKLKVLKVDKAPGPDGYLPRVLKAVADEVSTHFELIFNKSLESGEAPRDLKEANVTAIHKTGSTDRVDCYRPISLTSVPGKVLESVIKERVVEHLEGHDLLRNSQHGFRSGRSCITNLLSFFHHMFACYDQSRAIDVVYLDFKKAFDKVPHRRLLVKVRALGIGGPVAQWIESWLSGRSQRVVANGVASDWVPVTSGVPQGSVLGPLLFLIYINDLDENLLSRIAKFADDTKLGANAADEAAVRNLQHDLASISDWSNVWQMPFNTDKCHVLHVGRANPKSNYVLCGEAITERSVEKDLGVLVTNDLKFSKQCLAAESKAQKILGYVRRQFRYRNKQSVLALFNALVRPILEYGVQFWSPNLRRDVVRLEKVQARATKLIPEVRHMGYERRLEELNLFTLEQRRLRGQLIEAFKIIRGFSNVPITDFFTLSENPTRNHGWKVVVPRFQTTPFRELMTVKLCQTWNNLPVNVVNSDTVDTFKRRLDRILRGLVP